MKRKRKVTVSGTPDGFTGSVDAQLRQTQNKRSPAANVIVAGGGPAQWSSSYGIGPDVVHGNFPALDVPSTGRFTDTTMEPLRPQTKVTTVPSNVTTYGGGEDTAGRYPWLSRFGGGTVIKDVAGQGGPKIPADNEPQSNIVEWWWQIPPEDWPPPGPPGSGWETGEPPIRSQPPPGYYDDPMPYEPEAPNVQFIPPGPGRPPEIDEIYEQPPYAPVEPKIEPAPPEGGTTGAPPFMAPPIWLLQDPDATGDEIAAARQSGEPWTGVLVSDGTQTMAFEEFAEATGLPTDQAWARWNEFFSNPRPEITGREGTDYWSTGIPFTSTMGTDQMLGTIGNAMGEDMLDTYSMVQNNPNVFSYPYRPEDPDGEWQPGFGQPVNPTMGQRPVPREIPYYDQRGLLEAQILDEMAMQGIPPTAMLDAPGYMPRDQHLYTNTPVGRVDPNVVLINILKRIRGMQ